MGAFDLAFWLGITTLEPLRSVFGFILDSHARGPSEFCLCDLADLPGNRHHHRCHPPSSSSSIGTRGAQDSLDLARRSVVFPLVRRASLGVDVKGTAEASIHFDVKSC